MSDSAVRPRVGHGTSLIVLVGVLLIIALIVMTLASVRSMEEEFRRGFHDTVQARQLAKSGIDTAVARLRAALETGQFGAPEFQRSMQYFGRDVAERGVDAALMRVVLEESSNPSFAMEAVGGAEGPLEAPQNPMDANATPRAVWIRMPGGDDAVQVGFSGCSDGGTHAAHGDQWVLDVRDASSMIYVNDGLGESPVFGSVTRNLRRILNRLGQAIGVSNLGDRIIGRRPSGGYRSKRDLQTVLGKTDFGKAVRFLTTHAWVDRSVANPVPLSGDPASVAYYDYWQGGGARTGVNYLYRGSRPRFRYGWRKNFANQLLPGAPDLKFAASVAGGPVMASPLGLDHAVYGMDELFPRWIELTSRAPVNVNTAQREVLMALVSDIHGVWVCERLRDNPPAAMPPDFSSAWADVGHTYDATGNDEGDQFGFLVTTDPVKPPGATGPNSSAWIADELIACRNRAISGTTKFDYARAPFGGTFRSWRQFNLFIDHLVEIGVLMDTRTNGPNHPYAAHPAPPSAADKWGRNGGPVPASGYQLAIYRRLGAQAIADALKANFNPNLHLNESNPDENRNALVDKTDLIVMSTEATFVPMGYFEIESLGRVLRPGDGALTDVLDATGTKPARVAAEFKIRAVVKLFDALRLTSQRDFYGYGAGSPPAQGESGPAGPNYWEFRQASRASLPNTNNALSIEIGPEPDLGIAPEQCRWSGYVAWPTNGGEFEYPKPPGTFPPGNDDPQQRTCDLGLDGCVMHAHFVRSDYLSHHALGERRNLNRVALDRDENNECWSDHLEPAPGPYDAWRTDPTSNRRNWHRLARDFRLPPAGGGGTTPELAAESGAPLDMRIDGIYLERHSTLAYMLTNEMVTRDFAKGLRDYRVLFSYWLKPKFAPEMASKPRCYWNWKRLDPRPDCLGMYGMEAADQVHSLTHFFAASQNPGWETTRGGPVWDGAWARRFPLRPASMLFLGWSSFAGFPGSPTQSQLQAETWNGAASPTLNHHGHGSSGYAGCSHPQCQRRAHPSTLEPSPHYLLRNPLATGRWMHFAYYFRSDEAADPDGQPTRRMYVNGISGDTTPSHDISYAWGEAAAETTWPHYHVDWGRLPSDDASAVPPGAGASPAQQHQCCRNLGKLLTSERNVVRIGESDRFSVQRGGQPTAGAPPVGNFAPDATVDEYVMLAATVTDADRDDVVDLYRQGRYHLPRDPSEGLYISPRFDLPTRMLPPSSGTGQPHEPRSVKLLGIAWTWAAEWVDTSSAALDPILTDYSAIAASNPAVLRPVLGVAVEADGVWYAAAAHEQFAAVRAPGTGAVVTTSAAGLRIRLKFAWPPGGAPRAESFVLATPFVDDITLFFDRGDPVLVDWTS